MSCVDLLEDARSPLMVPKCFSVSLSSVFSLFVATYLPCCNFSKVKLIHLESFNICSIFKMYIVLYVSSFPHYSLQQRGCVAIYVRALGRPIFAAAPDVKNNGPVASLCDPILPQKAPYYIVTCVVLGEKVWDTSISDPRHCLFPARIGVGRIRWVGTHHVRQ